MRGGHIIYQDIVAPAISVSQETVNMDKWYTQHHNPVLRKTLSAAIIAGSLFFDPFPPQQEDITVDKWYQPIQQPYFSKTRQVVPTGESRFEVPRNILVSDWFQPVSQPRIVKLRNYLTGDTRTDRAPTEVVTIDKYWRQLSEPIRRKVTRQTAGEFRFEVPRTILITDWWQSTQQPRILKRRESGLYVFELPRVRFDWVQPIGQPRIVDQRNYFTGDTRTDVVVSEIITVDKWFRQLDEPTRRKETRQVAGGLILEVPRDILITDWFQLINQPRIIKRLDAGNLMFVCFAPPTDQEAERADVVVILKSKISDESRKSEIGDLSLTSNISSESRKSNISGLHLKSKIQSDDI